MADTLENLVLEHWTRFQVALDLGGRLDRIERRLELSN